MFVLKLYFSYEFFVFITMLKAKLFFLTLKKNIKVISDKKYA